MRNRTIETIVYWLSPSGCQHIAFANSVNTRCGRFIVMNHYAGRFWTKMNKALSGDQVKRCKVCFHNE